MSNPTTYAVVSIRMALFLQALDDDFADILFNRAVTAGIVIC